MNSLLVALADKYFKLEIPTTEQELKSAYRREARKHHPDVGGSAEYFKKLSKAYAVLSDPRFRGIAIKSEEITVDGILLSKLGLGVDVESSPCTSCNTKGYITITENNKWIDCHLCEGQGFAVRCPTCISIRHGWVSDLCPRCSGRRWVPLNQISPATHLPICPNCKGHGGFRTSRPISRHYVCKDCEGTGYRPLFNPLWPKHRISK